MKTHIVTARNEAACALSFHSGLINTKPEVKAMNKDFSARGLGRKDDAKSNRHFEFPREVLMFNPELYCKISPLADLVEKTMLKIAFVRFPPPRE